jgi:branched-chain amino acid transport system substrate-binding protein
MTIRLRLAWFVGLLAICGCSGATPPVPINLGHVANLSGAERAGEQAMHGIRLALEEATADFGDTFAGRPVHVRHTDTRGVLDAYEAEAARLVAVNRVVGLLGGTTAKELAGLDRSQAPVLSPLGFVPPGSGGQAFCIGMQPTQQATALARFIGEELKLTHVAIIVDEQREESQRFTEPFEKALRAVNVAKKDELRLATIRFGKEPKWAEVVTEANGVEPKVVVFVGKSADAREFRKGFGPKKAAFVFAGDDGDFASLDAGPGAEAVHLATAFAIDAESPRTQQFAARYKEAFKAEPTVQAALGYEALRMAVDALKRAQPTLTHEKFREELRKVKDLAGLAGPLSVTGEQVVQRTIFVVRHEGSSFVPLKRYAPLAETKP